MSAYGKGVVGSSGALPVLGVTGTSFLWMAITALFLLAASVTVLTLVPKRQR